MISSKKKLMKKILKGIAIAIIIYITLSLVSTKIIYDSVFKRYTTSESDSLLAESSQMLESRRQFSYPCENNTLKGYLYSASETENGLVILAPGFRSESIEYEGVIHSLLNEGFDVFTFDPTGHGKSDGKSSIGFAQIIKDVNSTIEFISQSGNFSYDNIFLLGHSRGGYGVCCAMNNHDIVDAVVCINATDTSMDAIMAYSTDYAGNLAYANYPFLSIYESILFGSDLSGSSAVGHINKTQIPVFVIQSRNDEQIPKTKFSIYSKRKNITSDNVGFLLYDKPGNDGHTSILYDKDRKANDDIIKQITAFYKKNTNHKD